MSGWLKKHIKSIWLLAATILLVSTQNCLAISPGWIVDNHNLLSAYNPASSINTDNKCRLNILGDFSPQSNSPTNQYYLFAGTLPLSTDYFDFSVGLDAEYYKVGESNFKQAHLQLAGNYTLKFGTVSYGIAPGFYSSTTSSSENITFKRNRFSLNGGVMFENKLVNLGISATQLFTKQNSLGHLYGRITIPAGIVEIIPSAMYSTDFSYSRADVLGQLRFWRKFSIGGGWSSSHFAAVTARINFDDFYLGYSFSFPDQATEIRIFSHQIFAGYSFKINLNEPTCFVSKSIRYM